MEKKEKNIHQSLIEKCRGNDRNAQFELYKMFYKPMYNASLRILNNVSEAEDVMQDSFLDAFRKIDDYSGEGSFGGWLRKIVVNNSLDALRKRQTSWPFEEHLTEIPDKLEDSHEINEYEVNEIKKAIFSLQEDHRIILSLFLLEGYDHEEISLILGISNNASRTRFFRAKQVLVRNLKEQKNLKKFHPN